MIVFGHATIVLSCCDGTILVVLVADNIGEIATAVPGTTFPQGFGTMNRHLCIFRLALAFIAVLLAYGHTCYAELDWQPERTSLFAVGVLEWQDPAVWRGMANAQKNRRDAQLVQHFQTAGVRQDRIVYLQDRQATRQRIQRDLVAQLGRSQSGELLIIYFTGHGFRDRKSHEVHFANYDAVDGASAWSVRAIFDTVEESFRGSHVLFMADCCYSGGLVDEARLRKSRLGYACLCSSHSHNSSTGRWTFTESLLAGLRGSPTVDLNDDGEIDVSELGQFSELEMAFAEKQKAVYDVNRAFPARWRIAQPARKRTPRQGERIEVEWKGKWYRSHLLEVMGNQCKVHYVGFDDSWDEWVGPDRIRPYHPSSFAEGESVEVHWAKDNKWYPAKILRNWYGLSFVHYEGYTSEWDDWVSNGAIRLPMNTKGK